jgi:hypothetical protein
MTHQTWEPKFRPIDPSDIREYNIAYTRGYILALEDVLSDLGPAGTRVTHQHIRDSVHRTLESANRTLTYLEDALDAPNDQDGPGDTPDHARGQDPSSLPQ